VEERGGKRVYKEERGKGIQGADAKSDTWQNFKKKMHNNVINQYIHAKFTDYVLMIVLHQII